MRRLVTTFFLTSLLVGAASVVSAAQGLEVVAPKGVEVSVMVAPPGLQSLAASRLPAFDINPDGLPVFADGSNLRVFGSPNALATAGSAPIGNFAWMRDGALLLTTGSRLAGLGPKGVELGPETPVANMRVRPAGADTAYVFGGDREPDNHDVYLFSRDGRIAKLASLPSPVTDVAGDGGLTYIASGLALLRLKEGRPVQVVFKTPDPIVSLAEDSGRLFYATTSSVGFLSRDGAAQDFIRGGGGLVRLHGDALFVMLANGSGILRFRPVSKFESEPAAMSAQ